ncbi:hypothetical protein FRC10_009648 [Ceratobasidium sp. 414]|nr:hypothetical protein FRC10_009648 [Ceratobasidium sp. 414]
MVLDLSSATVPADSPCRAAPKDSRRRRPFQPHRADFRLTMPPKAKNNAQQAQDSAAPRAGATLGGRTLALSPDSLRRAMSMSGADASNSSAAAKAKKPRATGGKNKTAAEKAQARVDAGTSGRPSTTPALDEEALAKNRSTWDREALRFKELPTELLGPTTMELEREAELGKWRLGHAYLRFAGVGGVHGVVNLTDDPNDRHNPRALDPVHVANLGHTFSMTGGKQDRESPIYLKCPPTIIDPACLAAMKGVGRAVSARDLDFSPPALRLVRPRADLEDDLEAQLWFKRDQSSGDYFTADQLASKQEWLDDLRRSRPMATLVNGNHRTSAMLAACVMLHDARDHIIELDKAGEIAPEDLGLKLQRLRESVKSATYRCEVYRENTPQHILATLSENAPPRQSMAAARGEQLWSLSERIEGAMGKYKAKGDSREEAMNRAMEDVRAGRGKILGDGGSDEKPQKGKGKGRGGKGKKGDSTTQPQGEADDTIDNLLKRSTTVEMILDTRVALWVYTNKVGAGTAAAMVQDTGASLTAHFWLGVRCLIRILNVANGNGLTDAENWVRCTPLTVDGSALALVHWDALHAREKPSPTYMPAYGPEQSNTFGLLIEETRKGLRSSDGSIDWSADDVVLASRGVYDRFAAEYDKSTAESGRWIAASLRLFARLPLWSSGRRDPAFYPAAALPATAWISAKASEANAQQAAMGAESTMALELLLQRWQLPWTQGTQAGNGVNHANWYKRLRGLHQILMWCWQTKAAGGRDTRLMTAIRILDNPRLLTGICAFRGQFDKLYRTLNERCVANKSGRATYGIVPTLVSRYEARMGGEAVTQAKLGKAKDALVEWVFRGAADADLGATLAQHPVLGLISRGYWDDFDMRRWCQGWKDQPSKQRGTVAAAVGWGILSDELLHQVVQPVLDSPTEARWLLHVVRDLMDMRGLEPWWPAEQFAYTMPSPVMAPADPPPPPVAEHPLPPPVAAHPLPPPAAKHPSLPPAAKHPSLPPVAEHPLAPPAVDPLPVANTDKRSTVEAPPRTSTSRTTESAPQVPQSSSPWRLSPAPAAPDSPDESGKGKDAVRPCTSKPPPKSKSWISTSEDEDGDDEGERPSKDEGGAVTDAPDPNAAPDAEDKGDRAQDIREATQRLLPPYVFHGAAWSKSLYQHVVGVDAMLRHTQPTTTERDETRMQALRDSEAIGLELNRRVSVERQRLRETMLAFGLACASSPYGSDLATSALPAIMGSIKDIFLVNLVKSFQAAPGVTMLTGINEAMSIATSDGLFEHDVATIHEQTNHLRLDLSHSFALGNQAKVGDSAEVDVGVLNGTLAGGYSRLFFFNVGGRLRGVVGVLDRAHTLRILDHFHPARGIGRTEAESLQRACDAVLLQGMQQVSRDHRPGEYIFMHRDRTGPPLPSSLPPVQVFDQASQCQTVIGDGNAAYKLTGWRRVSRAACYTLQPELSGYSTGAFQRDDISVPVVGDVDPAAASMQTLIEEVGGRLTSDWTRGQSHEHCDYVGTLSAFAPNKPRHTLSSPQPGPAPLSPGTGPAATPPSPITAGLLEPGGELSPDSLAKALADGKFGQPAVPAVKPAVSAVKPAVSASKPTVSAGKPAVSIRIPAVLARTPIVLARRSSSEASSPESSPTEGVAARKGEVRGRPLDRPAKLDLSQARDSSPESIGSTGDEGDREEPPLPPSRNPSNARALFSPTPLTTPNPRKRRAPSDSSVSDGLDDSPGPSVSQRIPSGRQKPAGANGGARSRTIAPAVKATATPAAVSVPKTKNSTAAPPTARRKVSHAPPL